MSFSAFITPYYAERLHAYEHLDLKQCSEAELLDVAGEASALHKFLTDILEEGYTATVNRLVGQIDAINRLQRFLSLVLQHLGGPRNGNAFTSSRTRSPSPNSPPRRSQGERRSSCTRISPISITRQTRQWTLPPASSMPTSSSAGKPKPRC